MANSADAITLDSISEQFADAVDRAAAWIVSVHARRGPGATGTVLAPDLIVTADHVIDQRHEENVRVRLPDGREERARLAGRDPASDLAVLRLPGASLVPAEAATRAPRVGSLAIALGRPYNDPFASLALIAGIGGPTRTQGGGLLERFFLVDTVLYPGFSGGPLIAPSGVVLGLNTSGLTFAGPDVALPWDLVRHLGGLIAEHGAVPRGYLGIGTQPVELSTAVQARAGGQARGLLVVQVVENGPAAAAGLLQGDIIVRLDGHPVASADELQAHLGAGRVGQEMRATLVRGGALHDLVLILGQRP